MSSKKQSQNLSICVVGLGYIGLPTAGILASRGHQVLGVDVRPDVIETINNGKIHIHEPHLDTLVEGAVNAGRLTASLTPAEADVFFLCVPTPINEDKSPDLSYVRTGITCDSTVCSQGVRLSFWNQQALL